MLGVCEDTVVGWEMRNTKPSVRQMPAIIKLIGCLPIEIDTSSFGGRLAMYRFKCGLTPKELGYLICANATSVRAWEANKHTPSKKRIKGIMRTLQGIPV
jgi:DNA-binding transcriptional regulator YiaG